MRKNLNVIAAYSIMMGLIILVGIFQSWNIALSIFNLCLISAVMTMGANIQWGYAGLINFGIMGFTALGGLAAVLISVNPVQEAWSAGGINILLSLFLIIGIVLAVRFVLKKYQKSKIRSYIIAAIIILGIIIIWLHIKRIPIMDRMMELGDIYIVLMVSIGIYPGIHHIIIQLYMRLSLKNA